MARRKKSSKSASKKRGKSRSKAPAPKRAAPRRGKGGRFLKRSSSKSRRNPIVTKEGRRLSAGDSCSKEQAFGLIQARNEAERKHKRKPRRAGRCSYQSASYVWRFGGGSAGGGGSSGSSASGGSPQDPLIVRAIKLFPTRD